MYRVVSSYQPFPYAINVASSKDIKLRNIHCYSDSKVSFDNAVYDETHNVVMRQREFSWLTISGDAPKILPKERSPVLAEGAKMEKVASGFFNISGGVVDSSGNIYFVDAKWQSIYCWSPRSRQLSMVRNSPLEPVQLAFDKAGDLLVISYAVFCLKKKLKPGSQNAEITSINAVPPPPRPSTTPLLPVTSSTTDNASPPY